MLVDSTARRSTRTPALSASCLFGAAFVVPQTCAAQDVGGDCNFDRRVDLTDVITALEFAFLSPDTEVCHPYCDSNTDGTIDISDAITLISYLFRGGKAPLLVSLSSELCDGIDSNCNGTIDEGCPAGEPSAARLTWNEVVFDVEGNEEAVGGYRIYFGTASGDYSWIRSVGPVNEYRVTGLIPGERYVFACLLYTSPSPRD